MLFPHIHTYTDRWHMACVQYSLAEHTAWAPNKKLYMPQLYVWQACKRICGRINEIGGIRVFVNRVEYLSTEARCLA